MDRDFSPLDDYLAESDLDGYLLDDGSDLSNQLYLSGFDAEDPFITLYTPGTTALLTSTLEYTRATEESRADQVFRFSDFDYREKIEEHGREAARTMVLVSFLEQFDVGAVGANRRFPLFTADGLREREVPVEPDLDDVLEDIRAIKTSDEIEEIHAAQQANEAAMDRAREMIENARVDAGGELVLDGEPLTSERVRNAIERVLLDRGYALDDTIVASGPQGAVPHDRGSGPIHENEPIIIDIFPRSKETRYHGDLTRTFLKGEPSETVREYFELTRKAKAAALSTVEPGATGAEVHEAVCDVYESAGYPTLRTDESTDRGFIHSTGHGVGLDVHELPRISRDGEELEPGHVITIEPGLYHPDVGGVRIEDLVVVTEDGYENLTDYPESLVV